ncbi:MAG: PAS domain S-box protein [Gemmatimonadetes bacterium]|nr:PAS domain S-box protein [Gemmatimonadota bacterium]
MSALRVLMLEDSPADAELVTNELRRAGVEHTCARVASRTALLESLASFQPDVILADHNLPQFTALDALRVLRERGVDLPVILVSGSQSDEVAVEYVRQGIDDYVLKENLTRLPSALSNALRKHQAERERADMETRNRIVSELASDFAYAQRVEPDGTLVLEWVTDAFTRITGYSLADLNGRDPNTVLLDPEERVLGDAIRARLLAGHRVSADYKVRTKFGEVRWLAVRTRPVWDDVACRVTRIYGAAQDVTERKRAEDAQRESQHQLAGIIGSAMDAIVTVDEQQRVTMVNASAERMFGYSAADVMGKPVELLVPERLRARHREGIRAFGASGVTSRRLEGLWGLRANGEEFPIEASVSQVVVEGRKLYTAIARDLTELRRTDEALARLGAIVESAEDAILSKTLDGVVTTWNPGAEQLFGYRAHEIVGRPAALLIPPDLPKEEAEILDRIRRGERVDHNDTVRVRKDGTRVAVSVAISPIRDGQGQVIGAASIARDITARKRAEIDQHHTTALLRAIVESSPSAIVAYDREGRITLWNRAAQDMFGWSAEEVVGKRPLHVPDSELERFRERWAQVLRGERLWGVEALRRTRDGRTVEVGISSAALLDTSGERIGVLNLLIDNSERKRAQRALAERERDLGDAQGIARLGSWVWDMRSGKLRWSDELYRLMGYRPREFEPTVDGLLALVHQDDRQRVTDVLLGALRGGKEQFEYYARLQRRDGAIRDHHAIGRVLRDPEGHPLEARGTSQDVTEQEQARAQLETSREDLRQLARRLEEIREEERGRISREIHDQLGQALTGLKLDLAWSKGRLRKDQGDLRERNEAMVELVDSTIETVRRIAAELRPGLLDDLGLSAAIEWQVHEFAKRTGIEADTHLPAQDPEVPPEVATALFRILQEALTNVVRHAEASRVIVALRREDGALLLDVSDNGRGIPKQAGLERSLGILGMRERAHALGGDVKVKRRPQGGTDVIAMIPVAAAR